MRDRADVYGRFADAFRAILNDPKATAAQKAAARKNLKDAESKSAAGFRLRTTR